MRDAASTAIASFHITDPDQAGEYLLQDLTYIYPVDPFVSSEPRPRDTPLLIHTQSRQMQNDQPYRHPAIESILRHIFFRGSSISAATYDGVYRSSIPELDEHEVPIPMVALAATAVSTNAPFVLSRLNHDRYTLPLMIGARSRSVLSKSLRRHLPLPHCDT